MKIKSIFKKFKAKEKHKKIIERIKNILEFVLLIEK